MLGIKWLFWWGKKYLSINNHKIIFGYLSKELIWSEKEHFEFNLHLKVKWNISMTCSKYQYKLAKKMLMLHLSIKTDFSAWNNVLCYSSGIQFDCSEAERIQCESSFSSLKSCHELNIINSLEWPQNAWPTENLKNSVFLDLSLCALICLDINISYETQETFDRL